MQRYIKMRTKQNNSHFFLYYSRFAVPLHPQNVNKNERYLLYWARNKG